MPTSHPIADAQHALKSQPPSPRLTSPCLSNGVVAWSVLKDSTEVERLPDDSRTEKATIKRNKSNANCTGPPYCCTVPAYRRTKPVYCCTGPVYCCTGQVYCCTGQAILLHRASILLHRANILLHRASILLHRANISLHRAGNMTAQGLQYDCTGHAI